MTLLERSPMRAVSVDYRDFTQVADDVVLAALTRWQRIAEHPLYGRPVQLAARTVTRTLEGLLDQLH